MMINLNYTEIVSKAKTAQAKFVDFQQNTSPSNAITSDKVTLSEQALGLMQGKIENETPPTYLKPTTARQLLAEQSHSETSEAINEGKGEQFEKMMQDVLDRRLGVDRKKLEEIDAMMEDIAKNENLSPEEKAKALEQLQEMREQIIEESINMQKTQQVNGEMTQHA